MDQPFTDNFEAFINAVRSPHLRAVAVHWHRVRGVRPLPNWDDLSSSALSPHFDKLWGFQYDATNEDFVGRLAGTHVRDWLGANFWGASLKDIHPPKVFADAHHFLSKVMVTPAAGRCSGKLFTISGKAIMGERIALPLSTDGITGDAILGASDYEYPRELGPVEMIHENMKWYAI